MAAVPPGYPINFQETWNESCFNTSSGGLPCIRIPLAPPSWKCSTIFLNKRDEKGEGLKDSVPALIERALTVLFSPKPDGEELEAMTRVLSVVRRILPREKEVQDASGETISEILKQGALALCPARGEEFFDVCLQFHLFSEAYEEALQEVLLFQKTDQLSRLVQELCQYQELMPKMQAAIYDPKDPEPPEALIEREKIALLLDQAANELSLLQTR
jgi:hypothetical protein